MDSIWWNSSDSVSYLILIGLQARPQAATGEERTQLLLPGSLKCSVIKRKTEDLEKYLVRCFEKFVEKNMYLGIYLLLAYRSAYACVLEVSMESERGKHRGMASRGWKLTLWWAISRK